jgi:hypothetical protein
VNYRTSASHHFFLNAGDPPPVGGAAPPAPGAAPAVVVPPVPAGGDAPAPGADPAKPSLAGDPAKPGEPPKSAVNDPPPAQFDPAKLTLPEGMKADDPLFQKFSNALTYGDWAKRVGTDYKIAMIIEMLSQTNEIMTTCSSMEGNLPTGNKSIVRTGLPQGTWRLLNAGIQPTKSTTAPIIDTCGNLEAESQLDRDVAKLAGDQPVPPFGVHGLPRRHDSADGLDRDLRLDRR